MSLKLAARMVSFPPYKIADLQENDTVGHLLDLRAFVPPSTKGVILRSERQTGTGHFLIRPFGGVTGQYYINSAQAGGVTIVPMTDQEITWANSVANDDWDLYLYGYFVQKRTR